MIAKSIEPLRKTNADGVLYTRPPEIQDKLAEIVVLPPDELAARCAIHERDNPDYVPSECLVTLVRQYRSKQLDGCGEAIFKALMERVLKGLPEPLYSNQSKENFKKGDIQEEARYRFLEMLIRDREGDYVEGLDFFEIRFAKKLKMLRIDAERKVSRRQDPLEPLEIDEESGDFSPEVEKATAVPDPFDPQKLRDLDYRLRLNAAIKELPPLQKTIIEMWSQEIPIESKEPDAVNISTVLNRTPKTIAAHRDRAFAALRAKMPKGEAV